MNKAQKLKDSLNYNLEDEDLVLLAYEISNDENFNYEKEIQNGVDPFHHEFVTDSDKIDYIRGSYIRKFIKQCEDATTLFRSLIYVYDLSEFLDIPVGDILYIIINVFGKDFSKINLEISSKPIIDTTYKEEFVLVRNSEIIENLFIKHSKRKCKFTYFKNGETISFIIFKKRERKNAHRK